MQNISEIEELIKLISKLPGLGPKSAKRIVLKLVNNRNELVKPLANTLAQVYKNVVRCNLCGILKSNLAGCSNCGSTKNGLGSLYDPACYWADREVDISMTKLFGGFNREFYKGYEEIWPLNKFSKDRPDIYNLYHLLNHANIFGGSYKENSLKILKDLRSRV